MTNTSAMSAPTSSKFSLSLGGNKSASSRTSKPQNKIPHISSNLALGEEEHGFEDDSRHEHISSFGKGTGSESAKPAPKKEERVISSIPDRDWQEETKRKRRRRAERADQSATPSTNGNANADTVGGSVPKYGLNIVDRSSQAGATIDENKTEQHGVQQLKNGTLQGSPPPQTADEEALSALLGNRPNAQPTIIAPPSPPPSEDQAYRDSYAAAPRTCTLEEYEATPVDGYGAAILRGYLKAGQTLESHANERGEGAGAKGKPSWIPERRPGLLGLGAKESGLGVELGAWGKGAGMGGGRGRGSRPDDTMYNPLARRNKKTGEVLAEDELKHKVENQNRMLVDDSKMREHRDQDDLDESRDHRSSKHDRRRQHDDDSGEYDSKKRYRHHRRREHEDDRDSDRQYRRKDRDERDRKHDDEHERSQRQDRHRDREYESDRRRKHKDNRDSDKHDRRERSRERRKERDRHSSRRS